MRTYEITFWDNTTDDVLKILTVSGVDLDEALRNFDAADHSAAPVAPDTQADKPEPEGLMRVVLCEPGRRSTIAYISKTLEGKQAAVAGDIEAFYPFDEPIAIICNDEGKINGMSLNRAFREPDRYVEMPYIHLKAAFSAAEEKGQHIRGLIEFTEDSFKAEYPVEARTYEVTSDNKAFQPSKGGYSIFGTSLDMSDINVRLDRYMAVEKGGADGWKIKKCTVIYPGDIIEIIGGPFFICDASGNRFDGLTEEQAKEMLLKYYYPERFFQVDNAICVKANTAPESNQIKCIREVLNDEEGSEAL